MGTEKNLKTEYKKDYMVFATLDELVKKRRGEMTSDAWIKRAPLKKGVLINTCDDREQLGRDAVQPAYIRLFPLEYEVGGRLKTYYMMSPKSDDDKVYLISDMTEDAEVDQVPEPSASAEKKEREKPVNFKMHEWQKFQFELVEA